MSLNKVTYHLGSIDGSFINDKIEIEKSEHTTFLKILDDFAELQENENLFRVVELNYKDFIEKNSFYAVNNSLIKPDHSIDGPESIAIDLNRLLLNFLSSVRMFLDHKETILKRKFGPDSAEVLAFKNEIAVAYDTQFEYRFCYKLRNYAQHCGLPINPIEMSSFLDNKNEIQNRFNVFFDTKKLLSQFDWGNIVKNDLLSQSDKFLVLPIVEKEFDLLRVVNQNISSAVFRSYKEDGFKLFDVFLNRIGTQGLPCLMKKEGHDPITISIKWFPLEMISKITGIEIKVEARKLQ